MHIKSTIGVLLFAHGPPLWTQRFGHPCSMANGESVSLWSSQEDGFLRVAAKVASQKTNVKTINMSIIDVGEILDKEQQSYKTRSVLHSMIVESTQ